MVTCGLQPKVVFAGSMDNPFGDSPERRGFPTMWSIVLPPWDQMRGLRPTSPVWPAGMAHQSRRFPGCHSLKINN